MTDLRIPLPNAEPCLDFGRIIRMIRVRIDGRSLEIVGREMHASRSTLARIEVGETQPEEVDDEIIDLFIDAVERHLKRHGLFNKKKRRFKQLIFCLYKAYDCHEDRAFERAWEQSRKRREQRKHR